MMLRPVNAWTTAFCSSQPSIGLSQADADRSPRYGRAGSRAGTQVRYGGLENFDTHQDLDFQDNHFYVDHYNFPHAQWDSHDWRQKNSSGIATGLTELAGIAIGRQAGRPYTVSEFNQPWPNQQANEIDVVTAAFGAFQDWDALMHFAYSHSADWSTDVPATFNLNGDWSKDVLVAQAAWLFRSGAIQAGKTPVALPVSSDLRLRALREKLNGNVTKLLTAESGFDPASVFVHPVKLVKDGAAQTRVDDKPIRLTKAIPAN